MTGVMRDSLCCQFLQCLAPTTEVLKFVSSVSLAVTPMNLPDL